MAAAVGLQLWPRLPLHHKGQHTQQGGSTAGQQRTGPISVCRAGIGMDHSQKQKVLMFQLLATHGQLH
jgi:hypothetical protein